MSLSASLVGYTPATEPVAFRGGSFTVRGLCTDDLSLLVRTHLDTMENVFDIARRAMEGNASGDAVARFLLALLQDAPTVAADVIAFAADDPGAGPLVLKLPFPVMVDALAKVGRLTFEDVGGPENFGRALAVLIDGAMLTRSPASAKPSSRSTATSATT